MPNASVTLVGEDEFGLALKAMVARMDAAAGAATSLVWEQVRETIRPDHEVTGRLGDSLQVDGPHRVGFGSYESSGGPTAPYARVIELGKRGDRYRKGHPWFVPKFKLAARTFQETYWSTWAAAQRGIGV